MLSLASLLPIVYGFTGGWTVNKLTELEEQGGSPSSIMRGHDDGPMGLLQADHDTRVLGAHLRPHVSECYLGQGSKLSLQGSHTNLIVSSRSDDPTVGWQ